MDHPCDFSISEQGTAPGQHRFVRMQGKDGPKVLVQIDLSPADLTEALLGHTVTAAITIGKAP